MLLNCHNDKVTAQLRIHFYTNGFMNNKGCLTYIAPMSEVRLGQEISWLGKQMSQNKVNLEYVD